MKERMALLIFYIHWHLELKSFLKHFAWLCFLLVSFCSGYNDASDMGQSQITKKALVGHFFQHEIPHKEFGCNLTRVQVVDKNTRYLPDWLTVNTRYGQVSGVPQEADVGIYQLIFAGIGSYENSQEFICKFFQQTISVETDPESLSESLNNFLENSTNIDTNKRTNVLSNCMLYSVITIATLVIHDKRNNTELADLVTHLHQVLNTPISLIQLMKADNSLLFFKQLKRISILHHESSERQTARNNQIFISWPISCGTFSIESYLAHKIHRRSVEYSPELSIRSFHLTSGDFKLQSHARKRRGVFFGSITAFEGTPVQTSALPSKLQSSFRFTSIEPTSSLVKFSSRYSSSEIENSAINSKSITGFYSSSTIDNSNSFPTFSLSSSTFKQLNRSISASHTQTNSSVSGSPSLKLSSGRPLNTKDITRTSLFNTSASSYVDSSTSLKNISVLSSIQHSVIITSSLISSIKTNASSVYTKPTSQTSLIHTSSFNRSTVRLSNTIIDPSVSKTPNLTQFSSAYTPFKTTLQYRTTSYPELSSIQYSKASVPVRVTLSYVQSISPSSSYSNVTEKSPRQPKSTFEVASLTSSRRRTFTNVTESLLVPNTTRTASLTSLSTASISHPVSTAYPANISSEISIIKSSISRNITRMSTVQPSTSILYTPSSINASISRYSQFSSFSTNASLSSSPSPMMSHARMTRLETKSVKPSPYTASFKSTNSSLFSSMSSPYIQSFNPSQSSLEGSSPTTKRTMRTGLTPASSSSAQTTVNLENTTSIRVFSTPIKSLVHSVSEVPRSLPFSSLQSSTTSRSKEMSDFPTAYFSSSPVRNTSFQSTTKLQDRTSRPKASPTTTTTRGPSLSELSPIVTRDLITTHSATTSIRNITLKSTTKLQDRTSISGFPVQSITVVHKTSKGSNRISLSDVKLSSTLGSETSTFSPTSTTDLKTRYLSTTSSLNFPVQNATRLASRTEAGVSTTDLPSLTSTNQQSSQSTSSSSSQGHITTSDISSTKGTTPKFSSTKPSIFPYTSRSKSTSMSTMKQRITSISQQKSAPFSSSSPSSNTNPASSRVATDPALSSAGINRTSLAPTIFASAILKTSSSFPQQKSLITYSTKVHPPSFIIVSPSIHTSSHFNVTAIDISTHTSFPSSLPTSRVPNSIPRVLNSVGRLTADVGKLFVFHIPYDTFYDAEDGFANNMRSECQYANGNRIPNEFWVKFDNKTQTISGLPMQSDYNSQNRVGVELEIIAYDRNGNSARDVFNVYIQAQNVALQFSITATIQYDYTRFLQNALLRVELLNRIIKFYNATDYQSYYTVAIRNGSVRFSWSDVSISPSTCNKTLISSIYSKIQLPSGSPTPEFSQALLPEFPLVSLSTRFEGICLIPVTVKPNPSGPNAGEQSGNTFVSYVVPLLAAAFIVGIIVASLVCYSKRRRAKPSFLDKYTFKRGQPVLLPEEHELKTFPSMVSLPEDYAYQKPLGKKNIFFDENDGLDDEDGPVKEKGGYEVPPLKIMPPPYRSGSTLRSDSRKDYESPYLRPPPTYQLPPMYISPDDMTSEV